ncbi:FimV/HubP family polar landmark protein [Pseudoalteromonas sp. R3]|nr:FimV/HubP family polar landmark protein [Pseudoalteromonas sp. R3]
MDVGLGDFEELLAGENATDVDLEEDGYAAKLDLVRAYIEIGDFDSAENAVEEILSNGPESVQSEAQALKQQIK